MTTHLKIPQKTSKGLFSASEDNIEYLPDSNRCDKDWLYDMISKGNVDFLLEKSSKVGF